MFLAWIVAEVAVVVAWIFGFCSNGDEGSPWGPFWNVSARISMGRYSWYLHHGIPGYTKRMIILLMGIFWAQIRITDETINAGVFEVCGALLGGVPSACNR